MSEQVYLLQHRAFKIIRNFVHLYSELICDHLIQEIHIMANLGPGNFGINLRRNFAISQKQVNAEYITNRPLSSHHSYRLLPKVEQVIRSEQPHPDRRFIRYYSSPNFLRLLQVIGKRPSFFISAPTANRRPSCRNGCSTCRTSNRKAWTI